MESLLRGLVSSTKHKAALKNQILIKMFANLQQSNLTPSDYSGLFKLFFEWILSSDQPNLIQHGHEQLISLANRRPDIFREFINPKLLIDLFTNSMHSNKKEMIILVGEILDLLKVPKEIVEQLNGDEKELPGVYSNVKDSKLSNERDNEDLQRSVINVARSHLTNILRDHGVHIEVTAALAMVYKDHPELLPIAPESKRWIANTVVKLLAGYRPKQPASINATPIDEEFIRNVDNISEILPLIWGQSSNTSSITECLRTFYEIISISDSYTRPSCALLSVIKQVPSHLLDNAMEAMIGNYSNQPTISKSYTARNWIQDHAEKEAKTVTALQTMIEWLCERPSELLSDKLKLLFFRLRQCNRNSVLIEVTHGTIEKLLLTLSSTTLQRSTEGPFFFLLLGFQHSETVFHQIATALPNVLKELLTCTKIDSVSSSTSKSACTQTNSKKILDRLKESVQFLMIKFPGFSQLYNPLYEPLESGHQLSKERIEELESLSWMSNCDTQLSNENNLPSSSSRNTQPSKNQNENSISNPSLSSTSLQRSLGQFSPKYSQKQRSATGMVGLINLGNTCYMNSVIQALYITDMFRELVFMAPVHPSDQKLLDKLQYTFAFLRNTMRGIHSPSEFLKVARPPWFESGRQHDCSEFLRYLLDCLHEQEKIQKGDVVVYGEHRVIETNETKENEQNDITEEMDEFAQTPTNDIPDNINNTILIPPGHFTSITGGGKGVRLSYSNTALDSISEAPEIIETDEDMISQGSAAVQGEDLMFGSRGSLSMDTNKHFIEPELSDDSEGEDGNAMGSRGSLGLSRWTTEDNLSFGGSKEKMDLIDGGTFNDSHSNSTDSGIQSVGDSITGSSDSMSNQTPQTIENGKSSLSIGNGKTHADQHSKSKCMENISPPSERPPFVSLVQQVFGGKMQTSYKCYNCNSISIHKECFTDLFLAFPDTKEEPTYQLEDTEMKEDDKNPSKGDSTSTVEPEKRDISMQQLVNLYLSPEKLTGENQYHCNKCKSLQDGIKTMKILEGPEHLICTLMRFKYDRTLNRKSKVFTNVKYELDLNIPVTKYSEKCKSSKNIKKQYQNLSEKATKDNTPSNLKQSKNQMEHINCDENHDVQNIEKLYTLYAIVVHQGYSSDGGHYFTYAKVPKKSGQISASNDDLWYIFNDSNVKYSNFESFLRDSKKFPADTAYVLFYQKIDNEPSLEIQTSTASKGSLPKELKMLVERDNIKFMREKERSALSSSNSSSSSKGFRQNEDEDDEKGGGGTLGCGGDSGFNSPGRFVC